MTAVSTSRKPLPEVRSLARDLAFAIGGQYITRGKTGMGSLLSLDPLVLIVSKHGPAFLIEIFVNAEPVARVGVGSFTVDQREGDITRGLFVSDASVYEAFQGQIDVVYMGENLPDHRIVFDGTKRKRYSLTVIQ